VTRKIKGPHEEADTAATSLRHESFENVEKFVYMGTTLTNQNDIHDEIKSRLNSGNAYYNLVQNVLSSRLFSKNLEVKMYKTKMLPVFCTGVRLGLSHLGKNID